MSRALPDDPFAGVTYYNSLFGLGGIVQKLADDCTTLTVHTGAPVRHLARPITVHTDPAFVPTERIGAIKGPFCRNAR